MKNLLLDRVDYCNEKILCDAEDYADDSDNKLIWIATPHALYSIDLSTSEVLIASFLL